MSEKIKPVCIKHGYLELLTDALLWNASPETSRHPLLQEKQTKKRAFPLKLFAFSFEGSAFEVEYFWFFSKKWTRVFQAEVHALRPGRRILTIDSYAYFVGSNSNHHRPNHVCLYRIDLHNLSLKALADIQYQRSEYWSIDYISDYGIAAIDKMLYIIGGSISGKIFDYVKWYISFYMFIVYYNRVIFNFKFSSSFLVQSYNTELGVQRVIEKLLTPRARMGVAAFNGLLYVIGGYQNSGYTNTVERFNPRENKWNEITHLKHGRADPGIGVLSGKIYVIGGENATGLLDSVEVFHPETNEWTLV